MLNRKFPIADFPLRSYNFHFNAIIRLEENHIQNVIDYKSLMFMLGM